MEPVQLGIYKCSQPECSIQTTGKCVNGLEPKDCTNKLDIIKQDEKTLHEEFGSTFGTEDVRLPWGESYLEPEISHLTYQYNCRLILVIGEPSCGKSTLYGALFDSFHKGGCGKFIFSSTKTPIGFERICHYAREKCKGKQSNTERTKSHEFTYLHLGVRQKDMTNETQHLIFADVSGERFQTAKVSDDEMLSLQVLKRADNIFFLADGGLLLDNAQKHVVKNDISNMITRCMQNNMISNSQSCALIVTKWDEITSMGKQADIENFFISPILKKFPGILNKAIVIASRSTNDDIPPGTGLSEFLDECFRDVDQTRALNKEAPFAREYQRFKYEERT